MRTPSKELLIAFLIFEFFNLVLHYRSRNTLIKLEESTEMLATIPALIRAKRSDSEINSGQTGQKQTLKKFCKRTTPLFEEIINLNLDPLPQSTITDDEIANICTGADSEKCVQPFKRIESDFQYFWGMKSAKTILCTIPKNLSTFLTAVMCLLNDELSFFYEGKKLFGDFYGLSCSKQRLQSMEEAISVYNSTVENDWTYLSVVRDPVDRFLSGFLFSCVKGVDFETNCTRYCFGCGANLTCFMERQYMEFMKLSRGEKTRVDFLEHHQYPQSWRCDLDSKMHNYKLLRYEQDSRKMMKQVIAFLESRNVSSRALDFIQRSGEEERTHHATVNSKVRPFFEKRLRDSPYLMEMLVRMYYYDFKLFNFDIAPIKRTQLSKVLKH
ncbi:hypothetical protein M3Y95_00304400 [Aphelenchoides besseyi]|nr:hypothetical protein M3Y95_00304400 [Aphelenchoides besseyi]